MARVPASAAVIGSVNTAPPIETVTQAPEVAAPAAPRFVLEMAPIPEARHADGRTAVYPWREMQVGHRFSMADKIPKDVSGTISSARKTSGFTFTAYLNTEADTAAKRDEAGALIKGVWIQRVEDRPLRPRKSRTAETPATPPARAAGPDAGGMLLTTDPVAVAPLAELPALPTL